MKDEHDKLTKEMVFTKKKMGRPLANDEFGPLQPMRVPVSWMDRLRACIKKGVEPDFKNCK